MITASIAALGLDVRNREVLLDQPLVELRQLLVGKVSDNADFLSSTPLNPGGHVELAHSNDLDTAGLVVLGDCLGTQETTFLNTPMSSTHDNKDNGWDGPQRNTSGTRRCG